MQISFCDWPRCGEKAPWFNGTGAGFAASEDGIRITIGRAGSTVVDLCPLHTFALAIRMMERSNSAALLGALRLEGILPKVDELEFSPSGEGAPLRELGNVIALLDKTQEDRLLLPNEVAILDGARAVYRAHGGEQEP